MANGNASTRLPLLGAEGRYFVDDDQAQRGLRTIKEATHGCPSKKKPRWAVNFPASAAMLGFSAVEDRFN